MVVRGLKDLQAAQLSTLAVTAARWSQRVVNSAAAHDGWQLLTDGVLQAFLRGLKFEQVTKTKDQAESDVQFSVAPGSMHSLKR